MVEGTLLRQTVRLADRRVEIDREGCGSRSGTGGPGSGQQLAADPVELANVAPGEAPQERAEGRGGLDAEAEDPLGATGSQGVRVVDAVAAGEGRHDQGQELVADVRSTGLVAEVEIRIHELTQTEVMGQAGRQQEPRVGDQPIVVEGHIEPVEAVR
jgi:hypothetical protein